MVFNCCVLPAGQGLHPVAGRMGEAAKTNALTHREEPVGSRGVPGVRQTALKKKRSLTMPSPGHGGGVGGGGGGGVGGENS